MNIRLSFTTISVILLTTLFIWSCAEDDADDSGSEDNFDRGALLENYADNYILPGLGQMESEMLALQTAGNQFTADPSEQNLQEVRQAYMIANLTWQRIAFVGTGPFANTDLVLNLNIYPTDIAALKSAVQDGTVNLDLPANRDIKGFAALDYMLYGVDDNDEGPLDRFNDNSDAWETYLMLVIDDMVERITEVGDLWNGYRDDFVSSTGSSANASFDMLANDYIFYYEKYLRAGKMGIPLGVFTGTENPQTVESYYNPDFSKEQFLTGLAAMEGFFNGRGWNGTDGIGFADYLSSIQENCNCERIAPVISSQFETAATAVSNLSDFRAEIEADGVATDMLNAYEEVQALVPIFKVDMVSALSVSIDYMDADGD